MARMRVEDLKKEHFDEIFTEIVAEKRKYGIVFIATFDLAEKLWEKFRLPYKKQADAIREKMRAWWNGYKWISEPRYHKIICGLAVNLGCTMGYDYCMLETLGHTQQSLISVCQDQNEFLKREKVRGS